MEQYQKDQLQTLVNSLVEKRSGEYTAADKYRQLAGIADQLEEYGTSAVLSGIAADEERHFRELDNIILSLTAKLDELGGSAVYGTY